MPLITYGKGKSIYISIKDDPILRKHAKEGLKKLIEQNREVFDRLAD